MTNTIIGRKCYVAGPMTGHVNFNYDGFHEATALLRSRKYEVINPAEAFDGNQELPKATYLRKDIESILLVDFMVVLPNWDSSQGACLEASVATGIGIPVFRYEDIRDETHALPLSLRLSTAKFDTGLAPLIESAPPPPTPTPTPTAERAVSYTAVSGLGTAIVFDNEASAYAKAREGAEREGVAWVVQAADNHAPNTILRSETVLFPTSGAGDPCADAEAIGGQRPPAPAPTPDDPIFILKEAERLVLGDRQAAYGHPFDDLSRTGSIWGAILEIGPITPEKVALCMVGLKLSREVNRPQFDNRLDAVGYLLCYERIVARRKELGLS